MPVDSCPRITVGLPVYNGAQYLRRAIDSILASRFTDFELIISDNGSTDETPQICREYAARDNRIKIITQPKNRGAVANFQAVVAPARGKYFMWAADDDVWLPDFMSLTSAELDAHPDAAVAMCAVKRREGAEGDVIDVLRFPYVNKEMGGTRFGNFRLMTSSSKISLFVYGLFRTELMKKSILLFPHTLGGDRQFMCQFTLSGDFRFVDSVQYVRSIQSSHEWSYRRNSSRPSVLLKQMASFISLMVRSPIVPAAQKVKLPLLAYRYAVFIGLHAASNLRKLIQAELSGDAAGRRNGKALMVVQLYVRLRQLVAKNLKLVMLGLVGGGAALLGCAVILLLAGEVTVALLLLLAGGIAGLVAGEILIARLVRETFKLVKWRGTQQSDARKSLDDIRNEVRRLTDLQLVQRVADVGVDVAVPTSRYAQNRLALIRKEVTFAHQVETSRIRELYLGEIMPEALKVPVPLGAMNELTGHPNKADMMMVCAIAGAIKAKRIFEFGTHVGRTTFHLTAVNEEAEVTTLDIGDAAVNEYAPYIGNFFKNTGKDGRIRQIFANSFEFDPTPYRQQFDFVFVDADHSYEAVKNDTLKAFELLRPGGVVMWHDYAPKSAGLVQFIKEYTLAERPLFRIRNTCLLLHIDGVDPLTFRPYPMLSSLDLDAKQKDPHKMDEIYHT
ncbi:methyltransferase family protein [Rhodopseudomonas thermotolerans]|uniref:Methyltransferase family protein n=3 Tax=Nitrobacteraceae TaxID=41294 RepID=A0A336JJX6_9BRAD|nr:methyltransferase family protein [Rhodopseudomonas pentothenatexigens]REG05176.1 methyltransferase family protein [Rhodopseudomonas thermotolerans]SSW90008.1 methyltransferase family protein [Rhodopseudomonas pentothenatexigens]